jgi:hypothetical protein
MLENAKTKARRRRRPADPAEQSAAEPDFAEVEAVPTIKTNDNSSLYKTNDNSSLYTTKNPVKQLQIKKAKQTTQNKPKHLKTRLTRRAFEGNHAGVWRGNADARNFPEQEPLAGYDLPITTTDETRKSEQRFFGFFGFGGSLAWKRFMTLRKNL